MFEIALLTTALMFGGMVLYSFGFAAFAFNAPPPDVAGTLIRRAFPHFYLFVVVTTALSSGMLQTNDLVSSTILALIAATALFARQVLMPAINAATDAGAKTRFKTLHTLSVVITLAHVLGAAIVILKLAGG